MNRGTIDKDQGLDNLYNQLVTNKLPQKSAKKESQTSEADAKKSKWRAEREKFIAAVRLGKQIHQLEKDPNVNKDESI